MNSRIQPLCFPELRKSVSELGQPFAAEAGEKICILAFVVAQELNLRTAWCTLLDLAPFAVGFGRLYSLSLGCGRSMKSSLSCSIRGGKALSLS
jgi:hypothetical protein